MTSARLQRTTCYGLVAAALCVLIGGPRAAYAQGYSPTEGDYSAQADADSLAYDGLRIAVGASVEHDSNLFRVSGASASAQSETISTGYVGLRFDKPYAQQRFQLDATMTTYRYDRFSYLDFNAFDYRAAWLWHVTPRVSGSLRASRNQRPTQFQEQTGFQSNVRTLENYGFDVDGLISGGWHVVAGIGRASFRGEGAVVQNEPNYRQNNVEAGIRYLFKTGSDVSVVRRRIQGDQDDRLVNNVVVPGTEDYRQDDNELRGMWIVSAKSTLTGRVTYLDRHYDQAPQRDFSGTTGDIGYNWRPTNRLSFHLTAARYIAPWQGLGSTYRTREVLSLMPAWKATAKTTVSAGLRRTYDDYPSAVAGLPDREDTTDHAVLGVEWNPQRSLSINASVLRQVRSSSDPLVNYDTTVAKLGVAFAF
jgi:exopolysaccharide biosynthesis operon protein EpsL